MQVLTAVWKGILNKVVINNWTNVVSYLYYSVFDIKELHSWSKRVLRKTRVVNLYDNKVGRRQIWERSSPIVQGTIQDMSWKQIIKSRVLIVGDINTHSSIWNPYCRQNVNVWLYKELIEGYQLIINNNTNFPIQPSSSGMSIIDITLISLDLGPLRI